MLLARPGAVDGARGHVLALSGATARGLHRDQLAELEEAFLSSTTREVQPVSAIDGQPLPAVRGSHTATAADRLRQYIHATTAG